MTAPQVYFPFDRLEMNDGFPCATVRAHFKDDDLSESHYIPSIRLKIPLNPHGLSFDEIQQKAIELAQGCIRVEALQALAHPRP